VIFWDAAEAGDAGALAELVDAFSGRLEFGTAGLRGALGPGPNRMNRVVVGQTAAALASYFLIMAWPAAAVIIGFDARHNSDVFARDTAEIMAAAGFQVMITPGPLPTPVVAFGIRHFGCVAGVVVTASHNPPQDNGYKVYLGDGSQIVPPADAEISAKIDEVGHAEPRRCATGSVICDLGTGVSGCLRRSHCGVGATRCAAAAALGLHAASWRGSVPGGTGRGGLRLSARRCGRQGRQSLIRHFRP
jgi:hypothetical protein